MQRNDTPPQRGFQLDRLTGHGQKQPEYEVVGLDSQQNLVDPSYTLLEKRNRSNTFQSTGRVWRSWWSELLSSVLLVVSFGGMIAMLRDFQDKPLPKWPLGLSFNTALSLFGAIIRFPAMYITAESIGQLKWLWLRRKRPLSHLTAYDDASRGPWGATKLLWTVRWNDAFAFLGATITIASLGFDPFTQAVVSFYPCTAPTVGPASFINHTNSYFAQVTAENLPNWARLAVDASFGDASTIKPPITCPTSTCSFPDVYHSIGLCSKCVDITESLHTSCDAGGCNYTVFLKEYKNPTANYTASSPGGTKARWKVAKNVNDGTDGARWDVFAATKYSFSRGEQVLRVANETFGTLPDYQTSVVDLVSAWPILASRCMQYFCLRSYTANVTEGEVKETLVSTSAEWSKWSKDTPVIGTVDLKCLDDKVRARLLGQGYISPNDEWMPWNSTFLNGTEAQERISTSDDLAIPIKCVYQMQLYDAHLKWGADEYFTNSVNGTLEATGKNDSLILDDRNSKSLLLTLYDNSTLSIDSLNRAFNNFTTVASNYMRTISAPIPKNITDKQQTADSFAVRIDPPPLNPVRGEPQDFNRAVVGQGLEDTTCIHVRWPWLALPAFIFVGTLAILGMLLVKTVNDQDHEVWKSSQNALIWHGLDGPAAQEGLMLASKTNMNDRAKDVHVQLRQTGMGWKLVQDD